MAKTKTKNFVDLEALAMELRLNELGEIKKREGRVGFGFRGRDHRDEAKKINPTDPWGEKECSTEAWEGKRVAWCDEQWREREDRRLKREKRADILD